MIEETSGCVTRLPRMSLSLFMPFIMVAHIYIYRERERERERERDANALGWWLCWMISRDLYLFRKIEIEIEIRGHGRHL